MANFTTDECESVRKAIDISLNTNELPDAVINLTIYKGQADEVIASSVAELTDEQKTAAAAKITLATLLLTASYIAPKIPQITSETIEGDKMTFQAKDYEKIGCGLYSQAFAIVDAIFKAIPIDSPVTNSDFAATLFQTAGACRDRDFE